MTNLQETNQKEDQEAIPAPDKKETPHSQEDIEALKQETVKKVDAKTGEIISAAEVMIESGVKSAGGSPEETEEIKSRTQAIKDAILNLSGSVKKELAQVVAEKSEKSPETPGVETAKKILQTIGEFIKIKKDPETPAENKQQMDGVLANFLIAAESIIKNIDQDNLKKYQDNIKKAKTKDPQSSYASIILKEAGTAVTEQGLDQWAIQKTQEVAKNVAKDQLKGQIAKKDYVKVTAVVAKKLLGIYLKFEPELHKSKDKKETDIYWELSNKGAEYLYKMLDNTVTAEDEKEAQKIIGKELKKTGEKVKGKIKNYRKK